VSEPVNLTRLASIVEDVPTLPSVMFEVLAIAEDEDSTARDLEEVIMRDQALSAKILKVANSAYYGIPRTVETVSRATVLLGFQTVVGLALTVSVYDTLWGAGKGHYLDRRELWKHSLGVATAARLLEGGKNSKENAAAFTAGMLHDIGKTILDNYLPDEYSQVIDICQKDGVQVHEAEAAILGATHAELGYRVGRRWQLPELLCESIRWHHDVAHSSQEYERPAALISLADYTTRQVGIGDAGDSSHPAIDGDALRVWGGNPDQLGEIAGELEGYRESIEELQA